MKREDIEKIKTIEPHAFETDREKQWYEVGLVHGMQIADEQPHVLWRSPKEKPEQDSWFLGQIGDKVFDTFVCAVDDKDWPEWSHGVNLKRWIYIKDLIRK